MAHIEWHRHSPEFKVDTHVLVHNSKKSPGWLEQCLRSLETEPTNILLVWDDSSNVGAIRSEAMTHGDAKYLNFVDDDDWVVEGSYKACLDVLEANPTLVGVYTDYTDIDAETGKKLRKTSKRPWSIVNQFYNPFEVLHLHLYRRDIATKYLEDLKDWETLEEAFLFAMMTQHGDWKKLNFNGCFKRLHATGAGSRITPELILKMNSIVKPHMLAEMKMAV